LCYFLDVVNRPPTTTAAHNNSNNDNEIVLANIPVSPGLEYEEIDVRNIEDILDEVESSKELEKTTYTTYIDPISVVSTLVTSLQNLMQQQTESNRKIEVLSQHISSMNSTNVQLNNQLTELKKQIESTSENTTATIHKVMATTETNVINSHNMATLDIKQTTLQLEQRLQQSIDNNTETLRITINKIDIELLRNMEHNFMDMSSKADEIINTLDPSVMHDQYNNSSDNNLQGDHVDIAHKQVDGNNESYTTNANINPHTVNNVQYNGESLFDMGYDNEMMTTDFVNIPQYDSRSRATEQQLINESRNASMVMLSPPMNISNQNMMIYTSGVCDANTRNNNNHSDDPFSDSGYNTPAGTPYHPTNGLKRKASELKRDGSTCHNCLLKHSGQASGCGIPKNSKNQYEPEFDQQGRPCFLCYNNAFYKEGQLVPNETHRTLGRKALFCVACHEFCDNRPTPHNAEEWTTGNVKHIPAYHQSCFFHSLADNYPLWKYTKQNKSKASKRTKLDNKKGSSGKSDKDTKTIYTVLCGPLCLEKASRKFKLELVVDFGFGKNYLNELKKRKSPNKKNNRSSQGSEIDIGPIQEWPSPLAKTVFSVIKELRQTEPALKSCYNNRLTGGSTYESEEILDSGHL
jgi:hypothetical protein